MFFMVRYLNSENVGIAENIKISTENLWFLAMKSWRLREYRDPEIPVSMWLCDGVWREGWVKPKIIETPACWSYGLDSPHSIQPSTVIEADILIMIQ